MDGRDAKRLDRRQDGFGTRWFDPRGGRIEVLDLTPALASPAVDAAIRTRVTELGAKNVPTFAPVRRIERNAQALSVVTATPAGASLAEILAATEFGLIELSDRAAWSVAASLVTAVANVHRQQGAPCHGAMSPAHVVVQRDASVVLTGWAFADALATLEKSREDLWWEFGLPLAPSATLPCFDQRSDVVQLGCLVLSLLLRRSPIGQEFPHGLEDLIDQATVGEAGVDSTDTAIRGWLHHAVQLNARSSFANAVEALASFSEVPLNEEAPNDSRQSIDDAIRQLWGELPVRSLGPIRITSDADLVAYAA